MITILDAEHYGQETAEHLNPAAHGEENAGMSNIAEVLAQIAVAAEQLTERGKAADYIPELADQSTQQFGIAVAMADGSVHCAGLDETAFSIQSISKVFTLTLALGNYGDRLWSRVGREPSGSAFNSIVLLEHENGIPRNPFINAGAIVTTDVICAGHEPRETIGELLRFVRFLAEDDTITIDHKVAKSEANTGHKNFALAHYLKSCGNLHNAVEKTLGVYFHQCAMAMTCRQLAMAGRYLAFDGVHPGTLRNVISQEKVRRINALMLTCGHYDGSGDFAFRVGLPGKSGVGGGILAVAPGLASIAVWSPGLNSNGNSLIGTWAMEQLAAKMHWSIFTAGQHLKPADQ